MVLAEKIEPVAKRRLAVSIVMPCLNEVGSLPHCIANAREALDSIEARYGLVGEIVVADNGSTDGSQELATSLGARVISVATKGYGAALIGGFDGAFGQYLVMGDADGSYDFKDAVPMIGQLVDGADLCMGSRFKGGIKPGAMPWKNRHIGNPALTGILNLFFRTGIDDAHCGLRAITREAYTTLSLQSTGMEFASEMVIKASLKRLRIDELPATLSPDLRDRAPHLKPWRDGWRHLRYLFMLSPLWAFAVPALLFAMAGILIMAFAAARIVGITGWTPFGESWTVLGGMLISAGHLGLLMGLAAHLAGARAGYRRLANWLFAVRPLLTFESFLLLGLALIAGAAVTLAGTVLWWSFEEFRPLETILPVVLAGVASTLGLQTCFAGFLLAIVSGHQADFLQGFDAPVSQERPKRFFASLLRPMPAYTIVAVFCAAIHNAIMITLDWQGWHFATAQLVSAAVLTPLGYWLMSRAIFGAERSWTAFLRYSLSLLTNYPVQFALLWSLRDRLAIPMAVSAPVSTLFLYIWNYLASYWALSRTEAAS